MNNPQVSNLLRNLGIICWLRLRHETEYCHEATHQRTDDVEETEG